MILPHSTESSESFPSLELNLPRSKRRTASRSEIILGGLAEKIKMRVQNMYLGSDNDYLATNTPFSSFDISRWRSWHQDYLHKRKQKMMKRKMAKDAVGTAGAAVLLAAIASAQ